MQLYLQVAMVTHVHEASWMAPAARGGEKRRRNWMGVRNCIKWGWKRESEPRWMGLGVVNEEVTRGRFADWEKWLLRALSQVAPAKSVSAGQISGFGVDTNMSWWNLMEKNVSPVSFPNFLPVQERLRKPLDVRWSNNTRGPDPSPIMGVVTCAVQLKCSNASSFWLGKKTTKKR